MLNCFAFFLTDKEGTWSLFRLPSFTHVCHSFLLVLADILSVDSVLVLASGMTHTTRNLACPCKSYTANHSHERKIVFFFFFLLGFETQAT